MGDVEAAVAELQAATFLAQDAHVSAEAHVEAAEQAWVERLSGLGVELVSLALESLPAATTIIEAVVDEGAVVDFRVRFLNAAARAGQPDPKGSLGRLGSELWPQMRVNGTFDACLRVLAGGGAEAGSFWWTEAETYAEGGWEYAVRSLEEGWALWSMHDESQRVHQMVSAVAEARAALGHAGRVQGLTERLARAIAVEEVLDVVLDAGAALLGAARSGVAVYDEEKGLLCYQWAGRGPESVPPGVREMRLDAPFPGAEAARSGRILVYSSPSAVEERYPGRLEVIAHPDERAWVYLPVVAEGRVRGVIRFAFHEKRALSATEEHLLAALVPQCAIALERIELLASVQRAHAEAREVAEVLQRSLLPTIPEVAGIEVAVRYLPGDEGTQAGGDWYDVIALGAGRVAVVIGDVMGRGVRAAAVMGQLRAAVRAYAQLELAPADVLTLLDRLVEQLAEEQLVTCCFGVYDTSSRELVVASAGHFSPLAVTASGEVRTLELDPAPPLGTGIPSAAEGRFTLGTGECLALYTDGLVETRGQNISEGIDALAGALAARCGEGRSIDEVTDEVLAEMLGRSEHDDDTALLLLRITSEGVARSEVFSHLEFAPTAASEARRLVSSHARALGMDEECEERAVLLTSELVGNVLRHACAPVTIRLRSSSQSCFVEVSDGGSYRPQRRWAKPTDESGRGLELVELLGTAWGVRPQARGKVVWVELALRDAVDDGGVGDAALAEMYLAELNLDEL